MSRNKISGQIPPKIGQLKVETTPGSESEPEQLDMGDSNEKDYWVLVGPALDDELLSFVRCLRVRPSGRRGTSRSRPTSRPTRSATMSTSRLTAPSTRGMPHKFYHGRTGRVWNVTKRAVGVEINKQVGNRIIRKMIHVRACGSCASIKVHQRIPYKED
ncbi:hypothetical protein EV1_046778 [Malus domestica]